ncbi:MAG: tetratricopeptide repeat protein [Clostridia bacterium]|nr:tetratricopeptide repeat protein [Clostridia bacterium]
MYTDEYCESCHGKMDEHSNRMPIKRVLKKLDEYFSRNDLAGAEKFLLFWDEEARLGGVPEELLDILNEEIGFFRRTGDTSRGMSAIQEAICIIEDGNIEKTSAIGTVYVNIATTLKAFGQSGKALLYYEKAFDIYSERLAEDDYNFAALYNNMALAFEDLALFSEAENSYRKAVKILRADGEHDAEIAVSLINLAHLYDKAEYNTGMIYRLLDDAWEILSCNYLEKDGNFAFVCSKCAPSFVYFGQEERGEILKSEADAIYEGN